MTQGSAPVSTTHHPGAFLDLPEELADRRRARVVVIPMPYEATVTYGTGTAAGPAAILAASSQVELYDREWDAEPAVALGIHTAAPLALPRRPEAAIDAIAAAAADVVRDGRLVVGLGGEHTVTVGLVRGVADALGSPVTVVQLDAHSDLREEYLGERHSHACAARRMLDDPRVEQVLQLGIRSVCPEEVAFAREHPGRVRIWYAEDVHGGAWRPELAERLAGRTAVLTIDVDALDPSVIPATGTPEPDGLGWAEAVDAIRHVARAARVVALDCVELAPRPDLFSADYAAAKLVYKAVAHAALGAPGRPAAPPAD